MGRKMEDKRREGTTPETGEATATIAESDGERRDQGGCTGSVNTAGAGAAAIRDSGGVQDNSNDNR